MNWNDLRVFLAIAEAGSLAGAARSLQQNHSTVFRRLQALEADLEARLFDRQAGGYTLTPVGEHMLALALQADGAVQQIELEVAGRDLEPAGTVRITTAPNLARTVLPPAIKQLRKDYPQIVTELAVGDTDYDLNRREADIALRATNHPPEHLVGRKVMDMRWWLCCEKSRRRALPKQLRALENEVFIGADRELIRLPAFQWLEQNHSDRIVGRASDLSTIAALVEAGLGLSVLPADQNQPTLRRLFPLPDITGQLWLLAHPDIKNQRRVQVVWDALAAVVATANADLAN